MCEIGVTVNSFASVLGIRLLTGDNLVNGEEPEDLDGVDQVFI